jgi:hypothetical protein
MEGLVSELESELMRGLAPVAAPDSLWRRVQDGREARRPAAGSWRALVPVAALLLIGSSAVAWRIGAQHSPAGLAEMAAGQLRGGALDLESSDPAAVRAWVRDRVGVDVPLNGRVTLAGARMVADRAAAIVYREEGGAAVVVVARGEAGPHRFAYAAAQEERGQGRACLLCHT